MNDPRSVLVAGFPAPFVALFNGFNVLPGTTYFYSLSGLRGPAPSLANGNVLPIPFAGILSNLYVTTTTVQPDVLPGGLPGVAGVVVTININGVDSPLSVTVPVNSPAGLYTNLTDSVAVNAGDLLSIKIQNLDSAVSSARFGTLSFQIQ